MAQLYAHAFTMKALALFVFSCYYCSWLLRGLNAGPVDDIGAIKNLLLSIFSNYKEQMHDLRLIVEKSNKAIERIEASLSERLANLERQNRDGMENRIKTVQIRDSNGENSHIEKLAQLEQLSKVYAPRTCHDLKLLGVDISGDYFIDPDGPFYGAIPIKVYCDVKTGSTKVTHDLEDEREVSKCHERGCYGQRIQYSIPMSQIAALSSLSKHCEQHFRVALLRIGIMSEKSSPKASGMATNEDTAKCSPEKKVEIMEVDEPIKLKAEMTLLNGITVIVGCIIGSGIFVSPTGVLVSTGSVNLSLVVWTICGFFTMIGAYCYAELGCMIRKSGADYAYIHITFGPLAAFVRLWIECVIVRPCTGAIQSLTFALYLSKPFFPECDPPEDALRLIAAVCLCFLCFVNCFSVKWATIVQDYFTYAKVFALIIIMGTGMYMLAMGKTGNFNWNGTETDVTVIAASFYSGLFAYTGWNFLNFIIEEMKNPVRDLPRAIAISCSLCLVIYVFTIVAFHTILDKAEVLGSEAVAVTFANRVYGSFAWIIPIFVACSTFGAVNGTLLTSSRLFFAGAREGQMPQALTMIQINKVTPVPAVLVITFMSLCYLTSSNIIQLMNYVGFATWLAIGVAVFCVIYLRFKHPEWERPIKVHLAFPIIYVILTAIITVLPMLSNPIETGIGFAMIMSAFPVYFLFIRPSSFSKYLASLSASASIFVQKLFVAVPEAKED